MLVAQISDCHIRGPESTTGPWAGIVDSAETLAAVVDHLNGLDPGPDVVLVTGDLTDDGTPGEVSRFREVVAPLVAPMVVLPGNHEHAPVFREAFADLLPDDLPDGHCSYAIEEYPVRLVGIDTTRVGFHDACFDDDRAAWLDATLAAEPERPTLLFTHFPPFAVGLDYMDTSGLDDRERFEQVVAAHPQVALVVAGHLHRPIHSRVGGAPASVCPSTAFQLELDLNPARGGAVAEPPGFQLHRWDGERFVTHTGMVHESPRLDITAYVEDVRRRVESGAGFAKG